MKKMINEELVFCQVELRKGTKKEAIQKISELISESCGFNKKKLAKGFLQREKLSTTGFGSGFAIPHTKADISRGVIAFFRFEQPVEWESMDGSLVENAVALVMPENDGDNEHLKVISSLARLLMRKEFVESFSQLSASDEICHFLNEELEGMNA